MTELVGDLLRDVLRISLHPDGLAPRIGNLAEWRGHLLERLRREVATTADADLAALLTEVAGCPGGEEPPDHRAIAVPLEIDGLSFLSTVSTFGTAVDVTVAELSVEAFLPADEPTAAYLSGN